MCCFRAGPVEPILKIYPSPRFQGPMQLAQDAPSEASGTLLQLWDGVGIVEGSLGRLKVLVDGYVLCVWDYGE